MIVQFRPFKTHRDEIPFQDHRNANDEVGFQCWICWLGIREINTVGSTKTLVNATWKTGKPHWLLWATWPLQAVTQGCDSTNECSRLYFYIVLYCFIFPFFKQACFSRGIKVQKFLQRGSELFSSHFLQDTITLLLKVPNLPLIFPPAVVLDGGQWVLWINRAQNLQNRKSILSYLGKYLGYIKSPSGLYHGLNRICSSGRLPVRAGAEIVMECGRGKSSLSY